MKPFLSDKRGYTLVELMVVVAIMVILAAASTPVYTGYVKKAKTSGYQAECRAVYMAASAHLIEKGEDFAGEDTDFEELKEEIEEVTALRVEILELEEEEPAAEYGVVMVRERSGEWNCEAVTCVIGDELWVFDVESGTFKEKESN